MMLELVLRLRLVAYEIGRYGLLNLLDDPAILAMAFC